MCDTACRMQPLPALGVVLHPMVNGDNSCCPCISETLASLLAAPSRLSCCNTCQICEGVCSR